jgi:hypothetical protein
MITVGSKFGIQQIFDIYAFDITTGECYCVLDDLKSASFENGGETYWSNGGVGNPKILGWDGAKSCKISMENANYSLSGIALQTGFDAAAGATTATYMYTDIFQASSATAATTTKTATGSANAQIKYIFKMNADGSLGLKFTQAATAAAATNFSLSTKAVTFHADSTLVANDWLIAWYCVTTPASTLTLTDKTNVFSKTVKLVANTLARDVNTAVDYAAQLIVWKAKFDNTFTLGTTSSGEPSVHNLTAEALEYTAGSVQKYWDLILCDTSGIS